MILVNRDDGTVDEVVPVPLDSFEGHWGLLMHRIRDEAQKPSMRVPVPDDEISKVLVERYEDPAMGVCMRENGSIARVRRPLPNSLNVVTGAAQIANNRRPHARVDQQPHVATSTYLGAKRSPAMARYA
jgi:hypothetical protein